MGRGTGALAQIPPGAAPGRPGAPDRLFELARLHLQAGVYAANPWPLESILMAMLLEHEKALSCLKERLGELQEGEQ